MLVTVDYARKNKYHTNHTHEYSHVLLPEQSSEEVRDSQPHDERWLPKFVLFLLKKLFIFRLHRSIHVNVVYL